MSGPPPGYNAGESMLSGGTEQIVGVMGGGKRGATKRNKRRQKGGETNPFQLREDPSKQKSGENPIVQKTFSAKLNNAAAVIKTSLNSNLLAAYVKGQEKLWTRRGSGAGATQYITMSSAMATKLQYDAKKGNRGQAGFDRHGIILPKSVEHILVVPPVHGNMAVYDMFMKKINNTNVSGKDSEKIIERDKVVILFAPPFYAACDDTHVVDIEKSYADNAAIFRDFVVQKRKAKCKMYILTEYTQNSIASGVSVTTAIESKSNHVETLLEPSYVMYPYQCTLSDKLYSGLIFSAAAKDEVSVPESSKRSKLGLLSSAQNGFNTVAYPPNIKTMDPGIAAAKIPYEIYTFNDLSKINTANYTFNIFSMGNKEIQINTEELAANDDFMVSDDVFLSDVTYSPVSLGGIQYSIRYPDTDVVEDWKELKFTQDEADFLMALRIKPMFLNEIYKGKPWNDELATNLATIVRSNCFNDSRLVLHSQCQQSQKFIAKILKYLVETDKTILEVEAGDENAIAKKAPTPLKDKSPFGGPEGLTPAPEYTPGRSVLTHINNGEKYIHFIQITTVFDKSIAYGQITIPINKDFDMKKQEEIIDDKVEDLTKNYPGYLFKKE
jgi:hypothetical protein